MNMVTGGQVGIKLNRTDEALTGQVQEGFSVQGIILHESKVILKILKVKRVY